MTIREFWEYLDSLESPFNDLSMSDYHTDRAQTYRIYEAQKRLQYLLTGTSNKQIEAYSDEIFDPSMPYAPFQRKVAGKILELLEWEAGGSEDDARRAAGMPPLNLERDIDEYYRVWLSSMSLWRRFRWRLDYTDWYGLKIFVGSLPFKVRFGLALLLVKALQLWRSIV